MFEIVFLGLEQRSGVIVDGDGRNFITLRDFVDHVLAFGDFTEDRVLAIQMWGGEVSDEELAAIGAGSGIGHRENAGLGVFQRAVEFIREFVARAAGASAGRITALDHEICDHAVEGDVVVISALGEIEEICASDGDL